METAKIRELVQALAEQQGLNFKAVDAELGEEGWGRLAAAMENPLSAQHLTESMAAEPGSLQAGQAATDFTLARLNDKDGPAVTLSDHFGKRPVALVFGSYT
ncbi:MAG: hypothetical protein H8E45_08375 [Proteobacteria bacterium]|nr:hypothetical protein [Pseudomonadota bacterium]